MLKNPSDAHTAGLEPRPLFATDAEIEWAQRLRHRLEERYLGQSDALAELGAGRRGSLIR